jgi:DNA-binding response OmpR family regulator
MGAGTTLLNAAGDLDPAEMRQFHRIIVDRAEHMRVLIGNLLDVARIETGALPVDPEPSDLHLLVEEAGGRSHSADARNPLEVELPVDLPRVMADRRRIVQVLGNLLSNAAGYSPGGSPITVSAVRDGVHVAVSVSDRARGIPAELLPELFRKFKRASGETKAPGIDGSGLGLAICKGIVEAHGGRLWAESDGPGLGARFAFTLPAVEAATYVPAPASPSTRPASKGKVRVLAVDDNPQDLRYVRDVLTRAGYAPIATGDPADVPRLMGEERPHLVLLDLVLPGSDGIELMNDIRKTADVPVIFLSVYGQDETVARALDMGAADYVVKPFSPTELAARIRAALRKRLEPFQGEPSSPYAVGGLGIDYALRRVTLDGEPVELTATEYAVLYELTVHAPRTLTHAVLLQRVWGPEKVGEPWLVRDMVRRLRRKLGDDADDPQYIFTEPRVGYRMPRPEGLDRADADA